MADIGDVLDQPIPAEPTAATPDPRDERIQALESRLKQQEEIAYRMQQDVIAARQQQVQQITPPTVQPPGDPFQDLLADQSLNDEQRNAVTFLHQKYGPVVQKMIERAVLPVAQRAGIAEQLSESAGLRQKYGRDFSDLEAQVVQARQQHHQQTGQWQPLEIVYIAAKGLQKIQEMQSGETPERVAARTAAREAGKVAAGAENAQPATPATPAGAETLPSMDQIGKMSATEAMRVLEKFNIPIYGS